MRVKIFLFILLFSCKQPDDSVTPVNISVSLLSGDQYYYVNYFLNGATKGIRPVDSNRYKNGDVAVIKSGDKIYKNGIAINSWNDAPDGSGTYFYFNQEVELSDKDLNLYATW